MEGVLGTGSKVLVMLNWTDVLPHPDARVEWEFWTNSGDECGPKCDAQKAGLHISPRFRYSGTL